MFNGLADSIFAGTEHPDEAATWVKYLSGEDCQNVVGQAGVVFPARAKGTQLAIDVIQKKLGFDVSPFTDHVKNQTTFLAPVIGHASEVSAVLQPALEAIETGKARPDSMTAVNTQLNGILASG